MLAKQYVCHICNITIKKASKSGHLKTKTHLNNIKKKFNKIAFLPLDLQHTIMEYIPFSRYTSSFSIQLAHKSVRDRWHQNRIFYNTIMRPFIDQMHKDLYEIFDVIKYDINIQDIIHNDIRQGYHLIHNMGFYKITYPIAEYINELDNVRHELIQYSHKLFYSK